MFNRVSQNQTYYECCEINNWLENKSLSNLFTNLLRNPKITL